VTLSDLLSAPILAGLRGRCPRCGRGTAFSGLLTIVDHCDVCGLKLAENDSGDGPAVLLIFLLGFAVVPLALLVSLNVDWPLWVHGLIWGPVILGSTLGMLRPAKGLTLALQYQHRRQADDAPDESRDDGPGT
jgi:uncharacterized protein (DUF983 family)